MHLHVSRFFVKCVDTKLSRVQYILKSYAKFNIDDSKIAINIYYIVKKNTKVKA